MNRRVVLAPDAESELRHNARCIRLQAPEAATLHSEIRDLLYGAGNRGTYRVSFVIVGDEVAVVMLVRSDPFRPFGNGPLRVSLTPIHSAGKVFTLPAICCEILSKIGSDNSREAM